MSVNPNQGGPRVDDERTLGAPMPSAAPAPAASWLEIGRAERGDALWITWIAFMDERSGIFYRSLVVADGGIAVSVEREPQSGGGAFRALHRGWCGLPPDDTRDIEERAAPLFAAADDAVARAARAEGRARLDAGTRPDMD